MLGVRCFLLIALCLVVPDYATGRAGGTSKARGNGGGINFVISKPEGRKRSGGAGSQPERPSGTWSDALRGEKLYKESVGVQRIYRSKEFRVGIDIVDDCKAACLHDSTCVAITFKDGYGNSADRCFLSDHRHEEYGYDLTPASSQYTYYTFSRPQPECRLKTDPKGLKYRGTVYKTRTGRTCSPWSFNYNEQSDPNMFPGQSIAAQKNYCRNPDGDGPGPYCDWGACETCWDYCCIPECNDDGTPNNDRLNSGCRDGAGELQTWFTNTYGGNRDDGTACVFPFAAYGAMHWGCTKKRSSGDSLYSYSWCSTTQDYEGVSLLGGAWKKCRLSDTTTGGNSGGAACHFPFEGYGQTHYGCTSLKTSDIGAADTMYSDKMWCATTDNYDRDGRWGWCQES